MRVLITQEIDPAGLEILRAAGLELALRAGEAAIGREELLARVAGCRGLLCMPTDRVDAEVMAAGPLAAVANHAVGVDNLDLAAARRLGVIVTNTPWVLTEATADLTMALLLACARRVLEGDALVRSGGFKAWRPTMLRGADLAGARLGIVGMGRIGAAVAARAGAFGMEVVHSSRGRGLPLDDLLESADFVSLHCPLTPETRGLIGAPQLRRMKPTATLINTARGPVVDEAALARALREGWIAGAGVDVYEREPEVHPELLAAPGAVLLPHLGSATAGARRRMATLAASDLVRALRGEPPAHRVA
jgi:glyoxylate reductase